MESVCRIKAFDITVLTGVKPTGVLLDELHEDIHGDTWICFDADQCFPSDCLHH